MPAETKKLGEMLVDAGLIDQGQLQSALRHQRIAGGRMGSNLVAMGMISEDALMDFLAAKTGVPRLDVKSLKVPPEVLRRIPRRLAEQFTLLPVAFKEPRSLVVAMADPSDLNAVDGARFASGLTIEPMVASHSALKHAIADLYTELQTGVPSALEVSGPVKPVRRIKSAVTKRRSSGLTKTKWPR
jgi:type IV pilus assembly protein PilB